MRRASRQLRFTVSRWGGLRGKLAVSPFELTRLRGDASRRVVPGRSAEHSADVWCGSQGGPVTLIRKMMLEELQRRNYSSETIRAYINAGQAVCRALQPLSGEARSGAY
jgi:hypothetical protein